MANLKNEVKEATQNNADETAVYMQQINDSFTAAIESDKKKKEHEQIMDAVLSAWLSLLFTNFNEDIYKAAQIGIDVADKQLKDLGITEKVNETITADTFEEQVQSRITAVQNDLITVAQEIKSNSSKIFNDLSQTITKEQRDKLSQELLDVLKKNGVTYFTDKAGRKWNIETYIKMRTTTELVQAQRVSFFTRATQFGVDLVRIKHLNLSPTCELCAPFENKILSIGGLTPGYMTIQEAAIQGLFHPNCDHVPEDFELVKQPHEKKIRGYKRKMRQDGQINLSEANKKRAEYNNKKNFKMF